MKISFCTSKSRILKNRTSNRNGAFLLPVSVVSIFVLPRCFYICFNICFTPVFLNLYLYFFYPDVSILVSIFCFTPVFLYLFLYLFYPGVSVLVSILVSPRCFYTRFYIFLTPVFLYLFLDLF